MTSSEFRDPDPERILEMLSEDPASVCELVESQWLDFKSQPHLIRGQSASDKQRFELAKDVTAMANSGGGVILWGVKEQRDPESAIRSVGALRAVPAEHVDPSQVYKVLQDWVYPTTFVLAVRCFSVAECAIWALHIGSQPAGNLPYMVVKEWVGDDTSKKPTRRHFTVYRRVGTDISSLPAEEAHCWLRQGASMGGHSWGQRSVDSVLVGVRGAERSVGDASDKVSEDLLDLDACLAEAYDLIRGDDGGPTLAIQMWPEPATVIPGFFESGERGMGIALRSARNRRLGGFGPFGRLEQVERTSSNSLARMTVGRSGVVVQPKGHAAFVCCSYALLWASEQYSWLGSRVINHVALSEFVVESVRFFVKEVLGRLNGDARGLGWRVVFDGLEGDPRPVLPRGRVLASEGIGLGADAHDASSFDLRGAQPGVGEPGEIAFSILESIYHEFGFGRSDIPFAVGSTVDLCKLG